MNTVLVIDDEVGPRESLRILLKNEYKVALADHVDQGLSLLRQEQPDVVIMDIRMPGKNGIQGLKELRDIDPNVAVIMLTGFGALETAQEAMRLGANDYIKKPFDIDEIQKTVRANVQRTQLERRKAHASDSLRELSQRLASELLEKEELASAKQVAEEIAHDLRNPLTIVMGYCQLLSEQLRAVTSPRSEDQEETLEYLGMIEKNVARCRELAELWKTSGKNGNGKLVPLALDPLLREVVRSMEPMLMAAPYRAVSFDLKLAHVEIPANRSQLLRALHNVVTNALHALPAQDGVIEITCSEVDGMAEIRIADNGCGIPEGLQARVFDAYYTTKEQGKGTGLGLHITRKIVEEHDGRIELHSAPGEGTVIQIYLPLASTA